MEELKEKSALDAVIQVRKLLENGSVFEMALLACYATGEYLPIPGAVCKNPMKRSEFYNKVNYSKATMCNWIKAMRLVVKNNDFELFQNYPNDYPFSYDKLILIYENNLKDYGTLKDLLKLSVKSLKGLVGENDEDIVFNLNGIEYKTKKKRLNAFLRDCIRE